MSSDGIENTEASTSNASTSAQVGNPTGRPRTNKPTLRTGEKSKSTGNPRRQAYLSSSLPLMQHDQSRDIKERFSKEIKGASDSSAKKSRWNEFAVAVREGKFRLYTVSSEKSSDLAEWIASSPQGLKTFELVGNEIDGVFFKKFPKAMQMNTTITTLSASYHQMCFSDVQFIPEILKMNKAITTLSLFNTNIGSEGLQALAEALKTNTTITTLDFRGNKLGDVDAKRLAEIFKANATITTLDVSCNHLGTEGVKALVDVLKTNTAITTFRFNFNSLGDAGAESLANMLLTNTTITDLSLACNSISDRGAKMLEKALKTNLTLVRLDLDSNYIGGNDRPSNIKSLLDVNKNPNGNGMLCKAIWNGSIDQAKSILSVVGIDRNEATAFCSTALESAIDCDAPEMVNLLLEQGKVNPNQRGQVDKLAPLDRSMRQINSPEIIASLVAHGADIAAVAKLKRQQQITRIAGGFYIEVLTAPTTFLQEQSYEIAGRRNTVEFMQLKQRALTLLEKFRTMPDETFSTCFAAITFASIASLDALEEHAYLNIATNIGQRFAGSKHKIMCDLILGKIKNWDERGIDGAGLGSFSILQTPSGRLSGMTRELTARLGWVK